MIILTALRLISTVWTEARELERNALARFPYLLDS
jgi:hypothetical protein